MRTVEELRTVDPMTWSYEEYLSVFYDNRARDEACPGHEFESTAPAGHDHRRGWHPGKCKHCGKDMSYDSGD